MLVCKSLKKKLYFSLLFILCCSFQVMKAVAGTIASAPAIVLVAGISAKKMYPTRMLNSSSR